MDAEPIDVTTYAIPAFLLLLLGEVWLLRSRRRRGGTGPLGYERRDTAASLLVGLASTLPVFVINLAVFAIATWLWHFRVIDLGTGVIGWTVAIVGWDLAYYCQHRAEHEIRILWACHVNHHSSQRYNLSTAIRQPWTPWTHVIFYPWLALVGVRPWMIMVAGGIDLLFQFWVHTETIDRMPRWFEYVLNTPSHHRVHHGSNPQYLDKNYAGIFIVFDRMFGSFEAERERVRYGLTKNLSSFNPFRIAFHEYIDLAADIRTAPSWSTRFRYLLGRPGWQPAASVDVGQDA